jgi:hypothetical protein
MLEQYNIFEKMIRVLIFMILTYSAIAFIPNEKINFVDTITIVVAISIVFLIYDFYYPRVKFTYDETE